MKWIRVDAIAHAAISIDDDEFTGACSGRFALPPDDETTEVNDFTPRPYGVDTCPVCHGIVKGWHAEPETAPVGLMHVTAAAARPSVMTAAERTAVVLGLERADGPQVPPRARTGRGDTSGEPGDDLEWPDEPVINAPVVAGALVVPVTKSRSRRAKADVEIDSD